MKNAVRGSNIILQQIPDLWVHTEVRQARCRTNKNTPESLQLNKLCARMRTLALHEVVKAQCFSLALGLEGGGPEPASLIPLSNSTSCISTAVTVTVSLIMCTHHIMYTQALYFHPTPCLCCWIKSAKKLCSAFFVRKLQRETERKSNGREKERAKRWHHKRGKAESIPKPLLCSRSLQF